MSNKELDLRPIREKRKILKYFQVENEKDDNILDINFH